MVRAELNLVIVFCHRKRGSHDSGIVDEDVQAIGAGVEVVGCFLNAFQGCQVEL